MMLDTSELTFLQRRMQELLRLSGKSMLQASKEAGLNETAIKSILQGRSKSPRGESLRRIASVFGVAVETLIEPDPEGAPATPDVLPPSNVRIAPGITPPAWGSLPRDLPVWGSAEGGADGSFMVTGASPTDYADIIRRPPGLSGVKDAFALYVVGESMTPWRRPGQIVYVNPARQPPIMSHVVVILRGDDGADGYQRAMVKLLTARSASYIELEQYNPAKTFRVDMADVLKIFRVMENDEAMGNG